MGKTVITYGTFDLFHVGHLRLLQRCKEFGDRLIVAVSTDEFNALKGKKTIIPYEQRAEIVRNLKCVDLVIPETCWEQKERDIKENKVDIFIMGDDWRGKFDNFKQYCEVIYLSRTPDVSSSNLKNTLSNVLSTQRKGDLEFEIIEQIRKELD